jgi:hypothetical protein
MLPNTPPHPPIFNFIQPCNVVGPLPSEQGHICWLCLASPSYLATHNSLPYCIPGNIGPSSDSQKSPRNPLITPEGHCASSTVLWAHGVHHGLLWPTSQVDNDPVCSWVSWRMWPGFESSSYILIPSAWLSVFISPFLQNIFIHVTQMLCMDLAWIKITIG